MKRLVLLSTFLFAAACGDDNRTTPTDASVDPDSLATDAAPDGSVTFVKPTPITVSQSATGPDQFMSVAAGPSGSFYAAGYTAATPTGAKFLTVAKLTSAGVLDTTFAGTGIYTSTVEFKGGSDEIDIVVQSTGAIVVSGTIANDTDAADRDLGLFRLSAAGVLDTNFGQTGGLSRLDLSTAHNTGTALVALDSARGLAVGANDVLFVHANARDGVDTASGGGPRVDSDFALAKLDADGDLDTSFATNGIFLLDIQEFNATAKGIQALADGTVIAGGYAKTTASGDTTQPVLYKLDQAGVLDPAFAQSGLFHEIVLGNQTEIYAFAIANGKVTTAGYGHQTLGDANVWASLRFDTVTGERSTNFGGTTNGVVIIDPSGTLAGSNCRNAIALPGNKTVLIGSTGAAAARDGAIAFLTQNGGLDTAYGTGVLTFELGSGDDQWWGGAVSGNVLLIGGWKGPGAANQTDSVNDDSQVVLFTLE
jgi:uncharacterized delta-60 repeat protein